MTDLRPYQTWKDSAVYFAISQKTLPADLERISAPDFAVGILKQCWSLSIDSRPPMTWCLTVLARQTSSLFTTLYNLHVTDIPPCFKLEGKHWNTICNLHSNKLLDFEFVGSIDKIAISMYVGSYYSMVL